MTEFADLQSRFRGCLLGLAVGDALGAPVEFLQALEDIAEKYPPYGVRDFEPWQHPAGTYTDDTQMSLAVARALIEAGDGGLDELMSVMAREFVQWSTSDDNDRAPGCTCMTGCRRLASGTDWREAGVAASKGCGSAMRTAPIGLHYWQDEQRVIEVARASSLPTHGHPTAVAAAAASALLVRWALNDDDPAEYPHRLARVMRAMGDGDEVAVLVERIPDVLDEPPERVLREGGLGLSWTGDEAVASALYCFCRSPRDYRDTVVTAANTIGDSDSIACIAGAISGAYNGLGAIPAHWCRDVEDSGYLLEIADKLYDKTR